MNWTLMLAEDGEESVSFHLVLVVVYLIQDHSFLF